MKYPSEEIDSRPNIRILDKEDFDLTDEAADYHVPFDEPYNESGQCDAALLPEFGFVQQPKAARRPIFLPLKPTRFDWPVVRSAPVMRSKEDQYHEGEFWKESVRAPRVVYDLDGLGIDVGRELVLDRRSEGY